MRQLAPEHCLCHADTAGEGKGSNLPDTGELSQFNVPAHGDALCPDDVQALSVGADLAGIQRLAHRCGQL